MQEYVQPLGDSIKRARIRAGMTQKEVADAIHIDDRTVLNIENYKGNPKMEILFPLVRLLHIDPKEIFYPETRHDTSKLSELLLLVESCTDLEAVTLISVINSVLTVLRSNSTVSIK